MFKEIRRKEKKLNNEESISLLKESNYGILSVCLNNGYAYGVPLNFVYSNGAIYFHCAKEGQKLEAINGNDKVSFSIVNNVELLPSKFDTNYESVITFGKAYEVFEDEKKQALLALINKYSKDYLKEGTAYIERAQDKIKIIKIEIEHITGKGKKGGKGPRTFLILLIYIYNMILSMITHKKYIKRSWPSISSYYWTYIVYYYIFNFYLF